ncbi:hypothetical protein M878_20895 [Streptomyces roseochromogenus subsp. oscitans DS 12.976]|uniref:Uncharacterized protein n=1 Tax=Streptomyces roseochromogenus subsp. oscitans DS 12.976 TaxID=1352936 RepID=V6KAV2_STRRC|nr:hypothetical protein M878_20895 [Streptomyces roseochromogenus subsp. oscitans DS 12.976]
MAVPAGAEGAVPYVEVSCVDDRREHRRHPLLDCVSVRFEDAVPVRPERARVIFVGAAHGNRACWWLGVRTRSECLEVLLF